MGVSKNSSIGGPTDWAMHTVKNSSNLVQPTVVRDPANPQSLIIFFRDRNAKNIFYASSTDEGVSWTTPVKTELPNNNAGIEAFALQGAGDGIVIAYVNAPRGVTPRGSLHDGRSSGLRSARAAPRVGLLQILFIRAYAHY